MSEQRSVVEVPVGNIVPHPHNPRQHFGEEELTEMAASIKVHGILQPLVVLAPDAAGRYTLLVGERRFRAAQRAELATVPCLVRAAVPPAELLELQLLENVARVNLAPLELAQGLHRLQILRGCTAAELADAVGLSAAAITRALALLKLPESLQQALEGGLVPASVAYEVSKVKQEEKRLALARQVVEQGLTREQVSRQVALLNREEAAASPAKRQPRRVTCALPGGLALTVTCQGDTEGLDVEKLTAGTEWLLRELKRAHQQGIAADVLKSYLHSRQPEAMSPSAKAAS